jgi:hypothetical protein
MSDPEIAEKLLAHLQMGWLTLSKIRQETTLEFHQINAIMRDGEFVRIEPEQKEKLIKLLYGN